MGIDIGTPAHIAVHAFWDGKIFACGYNEADGDYGHVLVTEHELNGVLLWALHGHLSAASILGKRRDSPSNEGRFSGQLGTPMKMGMATTFHFQLSYEQPTTHDMPGVVTPAERKNALNVYPDPRLVLGPLY